MSAPLGFALALAVAVLGGLYIMSAPLGFALALPVVVLGGLSK